jgi:predicted nucleic acid-binding protein
LLFSPKVDLYAPDLLFQEVRKHKSELIIKSSLSEEDIEILLILIEKQVRIISKDEFSSEVMKAKILLKDHKKDIPYFALAMHLKCPIWSFEKRFFMIKGIEVLTTKQVKNFIR